MKIPLAISAVLTSPRYQPGDTPRAQASGARQRDPLHHFRKRRLSSLQARVLTARLTDPTNGSPNRPARAPPDAGHRPACGPAA